MISNIHGFGPVVGGSSQINTPPVARRTGIHTLADYQRSTITDQPPVELTNGNSNAHANSDEIIAGLREEVTKMNGQLESFIQETKEMIDRSNKETDRLAKEAEELTIRSKLFFCAKGAYSYLAAFGGWGKKSQ